MTQIEQNNSSENNIDMELEQIGVAKEQLKGYSTEIKNELKDGLKLLKKHSIFGDEFVDALLNKTPIDLDNDGTKVIIDLGIAQIIEIVSEVKQLGLDINEMKIKEYLKTTKSLTLLEESINKNKFKEGFKDLKNSILDSLGKQYGKQEDVTDLIRSSDMYKNMGEQSKEKFVKLVDVVKNKMILSFKNSGLSHLHHFTLQNMSSGLVLGICDQLKQLDDNNPGKLKSLIESINIDALSIMNSKDFLKKVSNLIESNGTFLGDLQTILIENKLKIGDGTKSRLLMDPMNFKGLISEYVSNNDSEKKSKLSSSILGSIDTNYLYEGLDEKQQVAVNSALTAAGGVIGKDNLSSIVDSFESLKNQGKDELLKNGNNLIDVQESLQSFGIWGDTLKKFVDTILKIFGFKSFDDFKNLVVENTIPLDDNQIKGVEDTYNSYLKGKEIGVTSTSHTSSILSKLDNYSKLDAEKKKVLNSFSISEFKSSLAGIPNKDLVNKYGEKIGLTQDQINKEPLNISDEMKDKLLDLFVEDELNRIINNPKILSQVNNDLDIVYFLSFVFQKTNIDDKIIHRTFFLKSKFKLDVLETNNPDDNPDNTNPDTNPDNDKPNQNNTQAGELST
ncbi:MAG: hypothetical protein V3575_06845 [Candidatus Absconditabacteria bacterium]